MNIRIVLAGIGAFAALGWGGPLRAGAQAVEVTAEGRAAGDVANCREIALTDALREAVRKGVGVDVVSSTGVRDFVLQYDRVFAAAFGHVKNYTVLSAGLGADGLYRVKVRAEVAAGAPDIKDSLALARLIRLKKSPRVALEIDELVEGAPAGEGFAQAWFEQAARDLQLSVVDTARARRQNDRMAARDQLAGRGDSAEWRKAGVGQDADFILQAKVRGKHAGAPPYGMLGNVFAFAVDLRALRPDTGEVVASVALPEREVMSEMADPAAAGRAALHKRLAGRDGEDGAGAVFLRVLARWTTEVDLGALIRIECMRLSDAAHDALVKRLGETEKITSVWPREFDSVGLTTVDVESRLDAVALKAVVLAALGPDWIFDHGTAHSLQFVRGAAVPAAPATAPPPPVRKQTPVPPSTPPAAAPALAPPPGPPASDPPPAASNGRQASKPRWYWVAGGAAAVAALGGAYWLGRWRGAHELGDHGPI